MLNTLLKRTAKDIAIYFPGKLLPALTSLITVPIFARLFKPEEYGVLAVIGVFTAAGGIAVGNWLTSSVMRFLPYYKRQGQLDRFYSSLLFAFALSIVALGLLGVPVYLLVKNTVSPEVYRLLPLAGIIIAASSLFGIFQTVLRANQQAAWFVGFELAQVYGSLAIGLSLVILLGFGVEGILWGTVAAVLTTNVGIGWWLTRHGMRVSPGSVSFVTLKEFAAYGLPGCAATIGTWILSLSDRYIIEYFRGSAEVGLYSMGGNIASKSITLVISSLMLAIGPVLINTWESENREHTEALLGQLTRLAILLVLPMVVGLSVLANPIFQVLTTSAYLPGAAVLSWVSLGAFIYGLSLLAYTGLILAKKTVTMAQNYLLAGIVNVVLNLLLVPRFGFVAAAVNASIGYAILLALNVVSAKRYLPWRIPWRSLRNALVAAGVMAIVLGGWAMRVPATIVTLVSGVLIGAAVYFTMLAVLRELTSEEKMMFQRILTGFWERNVGCWALWVAKRAKMGNLRR